MACKYFMQVRFSETADDQLDRTPPPPTGPYRRENRTVFPATGPASICRTTYWLLRIPIPHRRLSCDVRSAPRHHMGDRDQAQRRSIPLVIICIVLLGVRLRRQALVNGDASLSPPSGFDPCRKPSRCYCSSVFIRTHSVLSTLCANFTISGSFASRSAKVALS